MLITRQDIEAVRELSQGILDKKLNQHINDAQYVDIQPLLGEELYHDVVTNPSNYTTLLEPHTYTYAGYNYSHEGLKSVLIDFAYSRIRLHMSDTSAAWGFVQKESQYSSKAGEDRNRIAYHSIRKIANDKWNYIANFISRTSEDFPLWFYPCKPFNDDDDYVTINTATLR